MRALLVLLIGCANPSILTPEPPPAEAISVGRSIDAQLSSKASVRYRIALAKDQVARGVVQQDGIDVIITTFDPSGKKLGEFDSPNGDHGPEPFLVVGSDAGAYDIDVHGFPEPDGKVFSGKIHTSVAEVLTRDAYEDGELAKQVDSPRVRALFRELRHHTPGAADAFWKQLQGHSPIIEPYPGDPGSALATWIMQSKQPYVGLVGGPAVRENPMVRIADSDLFYLSARVPADARLQYGFIPDALPPNFHEPFAKDRGPGRFARMEADPNNARNERGFSVAELPGLAPASLSVARPSAAKGTLTEIQIDSAAMKEKRRVGIYTPPGYDPKQTYPLVIAFDGEIYGLPPFPPTIALPTILDNLIADKKLPPVVAAIVANQGTRDRDLPGSLPFADFIAGELVPRVRVEYHAGLVPAQTLVTGSSFGGLASTFIAFHHSDVIGLVLSNSGSYQYSGQIDHDVADYAEGGPLIHDYLASPKLPIRLYMDCGVFEDKLRDANRHFRDLLRAKGYDLTYREFSGSHDYGEWQRTIADGLVALLVAT
ncbi:MAG: DUF3327 domain-containing protein [Deltaproteobacteria bacterium]|nr:DUF3327 domain-containing protein [Deltaproteobacteria bacterium]